MPLLSTLAGILLILAAILLSDETWIRLFRPLPPPVLRDPLLIGAIFLRFALGLVGIALFLLPYLPFWRRPASPRPSKDCPEPQSRAAVGALFGLLACAFALRLYQLDAGLWYDEVLTYVGYARMPFGEILTTYNNENQHFVFTLLAHACFRLFGEGAWALRLPAALFGVASIWALYLFGRQVGSTRQALYAAALFTFSYHHVWFSQNARGYSGLLFWALLSSYFLLRALREDRPAVWLLFAGSVALGVYTHMTMIFIVVGQFAVYLHQLWIRRREVWPNRLAGLALGFCAAGLLTFTLHAVVLPQIRAGMQKTVSVVAAWKNPLWTALEILRGLETGFAGLFVVAALIVIAAGVWSFARKDVSVVWLLFVPPLAGAAYVVGAGHHLWPRFFYFSFGFGALVAVAGAMTLENAIVGRIWRRAGRLGLLSAAMVLASAASVPRAFGPKQDFKGAMVFVEAQRQPGDAVLMAGLIAYPYDTLYKPGWQKVSTVGQLNGVRAAARRTIVVYTLEPVLKATDPEIAETIKRDFRLLQKFPGTLEHGAVFVYVAEGPAISARTAGN